MPLLLEPGPSGHSGMCARKRERVKHCVCDESTKTLLISMNKLPVDKTHTLDDTQPFSCIIIPPNDTRK